MKDMKIKVHETKKTVRVKVRKCSTDKRKLMNNYFKQLVYSGYIVPTSKAPWQAAPHLVRNDSSRYTVTTDLKLINSARKSETWRKPSLEAKLVALAGSIHIATMYLCNAYWQTPLDPNCYDGSGIIAQQASFSSKRELHGLKSLTLDFQAHVPFCFRS